MSDLPTLCETLSELAAYHARMAERLTMPEMVKLGGFIEAMNAVVAANNNEKLQQQVNHEKANLFRLNRNELVYGVTSDMPVLDASVAQRAIKTSIFQQNIPSAAHPGMAVVHSRYRAQGQSVTTPVPYEVPVLDPENVIRIDFRSQRYRAA